MCIMFLLYFYQLPEDVDFRIMLTFIEFYTTMLGFVNYQLYHSMNLHYPPQVRFVPQRTFSCKYSKFLKQILARSIEDNFCYCCYASYMIPIGTLLWHHLEEKKAAVLLLSILMTQWHPVLLAKIFYRSDNSIVSFWTVSVVIFQLYCSAGINIFYNNFLQCRDTDVEINLSCFDHSNAFS